MSESESTESLSWHDADEDGEEPMSIMEIPTITENPSSNSSTVFSKKPGIVILPPESSAPEKEEEEEEEHEDDVSEEKPEPFSYEIPRATFVSDCCEHEGNMFKYFLRNLTSAQTLKFAVIGGVFFAAMKTFF